jgi:hypothetical protein
VKPRPIVQIQAVLALISATVAILLVGRAAAVGVIVLFGLGLTVGGYLALRYERLVHNRDTSTHRTVRDGTMRGCVITGLVAPVLLATYALVGGALPHAALGGVPAHVASIAACGVFAAMLTSSCVDWYLIRPFRDGVLGAPACQMDAHDDETALYYARAWIAHRAIAEVLGWGGVGVVLVVGLVALQRSTKDAAWSAFFTYLAPAGAVYLGLGGYLAKRLRPVPGYMQRPSPGLGRWAHGEIVDAAGNEHHVQGFVLDAAIDPGLRLLSAPDGDITAVPLAQTARLRASQRALCVECCEHWIPQCDRGLREAEHAARHEAEMRTKLEPTPQRTTQPRPGDRASRPGAVQHHCADRKPRGTD